MSSGDSGTTAAPKRAGPLGIGTNGLLLTLIIAIVVFNQFFGEKIDAHGGMGYDGISYAAWARDFRGTVLTEGQNTYHARQVSSVGRGASRFVPVRRRNDRQRTEGVESRGGAVV